MYRRQWLAGLSAGISVSLLRCSHRPPQQDGGKGPAKRVVSLSPNTTETLFALGEGRRVVGRSRYCDFPPEAAALPSVGGYVDASLEAILALTPDLVVGARGPAGRDLTERLASLGIATFFPSTESLAEIAAMIAALAARVNATPRGQTLVANIQARRDQVSASVRQQKRRRVLLVFGLGPIVVAGPESFANELILASNAENVISTGGSYPTLSLEHVMGLDPDVIINAAWGETNGPMRIGLDEAGWRELRAVKSGRVVTVTDETLLRPGPRIGEGLATLARAIHPEATVP